MVIKSDLYIHHGHLWAKHVLPLSCARDIYMSGPSDQGQGLRLSNCLDIDQDQLWVKHESSCIHKGSLPILHTSYFYGWPQ